MTGSMKVALFRSTLCPHDSSRHHGNRAHVGGPLHVYTDETKRSNGAVRMRPLTLPSRDQAVHSPERILSSGKSK